MVGRVRQLNIAKGIVPNEEVLGAFATLVGVTATKTLTGVRMDPVVATDEHANFTVPGLPQMIATNGYEGTRRVIDVSGDGPNNWGRLVARVRDETAARRITINGLPIINDGGGFISRYYLPDLDLYYRGCVIGGPGAFIVAARNFKDFARAIRKKLILEIAGLTPGIPPPGPGLILKASSHRSLRAPRLGYVYKRGCDIGERMRNNYWGDPDDS